MNEVMRVVFLVDVEGLLTLRMYYVMDGGTCWSKSYALSFQAFASFCFLAVEVVVYDLRIPLL